VNELDSALCGGEPPMLRRSLEGVRYAGVVDKAIAVSDPYQKCLIFLDSGSRVLCPLGWNDVRIKQRISETGH